MKWALIAKLIIFYPIFLAKTIKNDHKKADLFQNRHFGIFLVLLSG
jgi:hypothetical protein